MASETAQSSATGATAAPAPFRIMVVDDSAVIRGLLSRALEADSTIEVVASVANGEMAISAMDRHDIEVVVLDIEMPVMDGLTALPKLLEKDPALKVLMASTLTRKNAEVSLRALSMGAADYVSKPTSTAGVTGGDDFKRDLVEKVKALGQARRRALPMVRTPAAAATTGAQRPAAEPGKRETRPPINFSDPGPVTLRTGPLMSNPKVIAIGSSTGGPQALFAVLGKLSASITQPILITQHMPATFTTILAEHIERVAGRPCKEAENGDSLRDGQIYVAPGDYHMVIEKNGLNSELRIVQTPPENFCRPAVDVMLRSLVDAFGPQVLVVMLTGMGQDGLKGSEQVVEAGGSVIAQDQETSVVWGMPGAVATNGLCTKVLPIDQLGPFLSSSVRSPGA